MVAYSSFTPVGEMRCPGKQTPALNPSVTSEALRRVNWLINTYYNPVAGIAPKCNLPVDVAQGTFGSKTATTAGEQNAANREEVQQAVWTLLSESPSPAG
jgi:hypothetical protein